MSDRTSDDSDSIEQQKLPADQDKTARNNMNNDNISPSASSPVMLRLGSHNSTTQQNAELINNSNNAHTAASDDNNTNSNNSNRLDSPKKAEVPLESMLNDPEGFYAPRTRKSSDSKRNQLNVRSGSGHNKSRSMDITAWAKILKGESTDAEDKKRISIDSKEPPPTRASSRNLNRRDSVIVTFFSNLFNSTAQVMDEIVSPRTESPRTAPTTAPPRIETRPSLLPRKSAEEEAQHLREYEAMERAYLKKEKERKARKDRLKAEREKRILDSTPKWREIIDHWGKTRVKNSLKELSWYGVPPILRGEVWKKAIGNNLHLTGELYEILVHQAQQMKDAKAKKIEMKIKGRSNTIVDIALDLPRTFPALSFFQQGGPSHHLLRNVLEAYTLYRPDVGYVQGMSYIAALLLLYMDAEDAFVALCNLLNRSLHYCFYRMDIKAMRRYYTVFDMLTKEYMPRIYTHFQQLGIHTEMYILDWLLTCFAKTLPLDMATRIFDLYIIEGDSFLFRAGLGLLRYWKNKEEMLDRDFEECLKQLNHHYSPTEEIEEEELFHEINSIPLTPKHYKELLDEGEQSDAGDDDDDVRTDQ